MATTTYKTINVLPGTQEYYETVDVSAVDDTLNIQFDQEFMIDNFYINCTGTAEYGIYFAYPTSGPSGVEVPVDTAISGDLTLNDNDSSRNMWFRVPAMTTLRIKISSFTSAGALTVSLLGRG